ncbi:MAG: histidine kinase, partial [Tannerella sp.]|nr:histidine kinase [Tannerella sp.]
LAKAAMRAEVEQLQNQINPHFLFNMLNNINVLVKENPTEAVSVLNRLNEMLQYQFNAGGKTAVLLADDIRFLTDYLNLEKIRRDNFEFSIDTENITEGTTVPPLLFIPFVENAVKHGNDNIRGSFIRLKFEQRDKQLIFSCINSKPAERQRTNKTGGIGLINVRRRLDLIFGNDYSLEINDKDDIFEVVAEIECVN